MKRHPELELNYFILDNYEVKTEDGKFEEFFDESYRHEIGVEWLEDYAKHSEKVTFEIRSDNSIICNDLNKEVTLSDIKKSPFLKFIFDNYDVGTYRFPFWKVRGKELNERLFGDGEEEENYIDEDCPLCGHLLQKERPDRGSGYIKQCSNSPNCEYKDMSKVKWKKFNLQSYKKKNTSKRELWVDLNHPITELLAKKMPHLFNFDDEMIKKFNLQNEIEDKEDGIGQKCSNCDSKRPFRIIGYTVKAQKGKKTSVNDWDNMITTHHVCSICNNPGPSSWCGKELTEKFSFLIDSL